VLRPIEGPAFGYRYRARLSVRNVHKKGTVLVGFHERKSSYVADMKGCAVLPPHVSALLLPLRTLIGDPLSTLNALRVTLDRSVRGEPRHEPVFRTGMKRPVYPFGKQHVLELKFTDRFPDWFRDLVQHFNLLQTGAPKYCGSVMSAGEARVIRGDPPTPQERLADIIKYC
jgi:23S rRNA (uracil1939-C5)-methyltransferase